MVTCIWNSTQRVWIQICARFHRPVKHITLVVVSCQEEREDPRVAVWISATSSRFPSCPIDVITPC